MSHGRERGAALLCIAALAGCDSGDNAPPPALAAPPPIVSDPSAVSGATPFAAGCQGITSTGTLYVNAEAEPFIAVNPANPANLIGVWQQDRWSNGGARGVLAGASTNAGVDWTVSAVPFSQCAGGSAANGGDYDKATDPWIGIGADGVAYFMALSFSEAPSAMLVSRSTDGGLTWEPPVKLVESTDPALFHDKNSLTADPYEAGHAYAIWDRYDFNTGEAPIFFSRTTDGGVTWEEARIIYDPGSDRGTIGSVIAVLPDGTLVDLFSERDRITGQGWLRLIRSTDRGANWSTPTTIAELLPIGAYDPVTDTFVRSGSGLGTIAVAPTGMLYVAWEDARFSGGATEGIAFAMSADGGHTWTEPVQANGAPGTDAFTPSLAVAPDGTIGLSYFDWRDNDAAAALTTATWLATSTDGVTWTERELGQPFDLSYAARSGAKSLFLGDYQGLAATADAFLAFYVATNASTANRSDAQFHALPVAATAAARTWVARAAPRFVVTQPWRERIALQLEVKPRHFPDRPPPWFLRRR